MFDGALVRQIRLQRGWTVSELAGMVGVARPYISQLEAGKRNPSPKVMEKLATALEVNIDTLTLSDSNAEGQDTGESQIEINRDGNSGDVKLAYSGKIFTAQQANVGGAPDAALIYTPAVITGLINGWLADLRFSLLNQHVQYRDFTLEGTLVYTAVQADGKSRFECIVTTTHVALRTFDNSDQLLTLITGFAQICSREPDLVTRVTAYETLSDEYVWFSEYASMADRLEFWRNRSANDETRVVILSSELKDLIRLQSLIYSDGARGP